MVTIEHSAESDRDLYRVAGEIDMASCDTLRDATSSAARDVVLDFSDVSFCDSSCLAVLAALQQRLVDANHRLRVIGVQSAVMKVFEVSGLIEVLGIEPAISPDS